MNRYAKILFFISMTLMSCQDVESLAKSIAQADALECEFIGFASSPSRLYRKFEKLKSKATKDELLEFIDRDNPVLSIYASYALIDNTLIEPHKLMEKFITDTTTVPDFCGCLLGGSTSVSSSIYFRYYGTRVEFDEGNVDAEPIVNDNRELQLMDSIILYSDTPRELLLYSALKNRLYSSKYHLRIEELAFENIEFEAIKYVFQNLRKGREDKLIVAMNKFIAEVDEKFGNGYKSKVNEMLKDFE